MIQEIGEGRFNPAYMRKNPQEDDILLHYEYNKVMLIKEGDRYRLPAFRDLKGEEDAVESVSYLFSIVPKGIIWQIRFKCRNLAALLWRDCRSSAL